MAAPEYVPTFSTRPKHYTAPPRRPDAWVADRPGEIVGASQPAGRGLGYQGPDQGFAIKIVRTFHDQVHLTSGEHFDDIEHGALAIALRRASMFSRAPVVHDLRIALTIFGFLDENAPEELVRIRRGLFDELANHHHYFEGRHLADLVPEATLRLTADGADAAYRSDWRATAGLAEA